MQYNPLIVYPCFAIKYIFFTQIDLANAINNHLSLKIRVMKNHLLNLCFRVVNSQGYFVVKKLV